MRLKALFLFCSLLFMSEIYCQTAVTELSKPELRKNVVYGTIGFYPEEFYGTILGNYERKLYQFPNSCINSLWVRVAAGPWGSWGSEGWNYVSTLSLLTGKKASHIEFGAGAVLSWDTSAKHFYPIWSDNYIAANLGYRYQKPGGSFVFRTGIGWPEFLYLSLGFCF
jgi:hypothetical protein